MKTSRAVLLCTLFAAAVVACKGEGTTPADAGASAVHPAAEAAAETAAKKFDEAVAKGQWALAKAHADVLLAQYADTAAGKRVRAQLDDIKAKADAEREDKRLAGLWTYGTEPVKGGGTQLSASIYAKQDVDTDGSGPHPVRLIFRDHPSWGKSSYLVLQAGDFDCYAGCRVPVKLDDAAPRPMAASRPKTDEAIAMFIEDERALWRMAKDAKVMTIEFPTKRAGKKTAVFEVGGLNPEKLPAWN